MSATDESMSATDYDVYPLNRFDTDGSLKTDYSSMVQEEHREARKRRQDACEHYTDRWYSLTATDYILCLDCGFQFPVPDEIVRGHFERKTKRARQQQCEEDE
jgi:hypothetical protein